RVIALDGDAAVDADALYLLLEGHIDLIDADHGGRVALAPGELFGYGTAARVPEPWTARAHRGAPVARVAAADIDAACAAHPALRAFILPGGAAVNARSTDPHLNLMTTPVRALVKRA
ncbi:hypothetical protein NK983_25415, partial [Salmonella enterica subsp. enterica serovar Typhimurium]|nr:hypothetical protein [Salmonella enterica subsp. enterica serovar Typhimurium]